MKKNFTHNIDTFYSSFYSDFEFYNEVKIVKKNCLCILFRLYIMSGYCKNYTIMIHNKNIK